MKGPRWYRQYVLEDRERRLDDMVWAFEHDDELICWNEGVPIYRSRLLLILDKLKDSGS